MSDYFGFAKDLKPGDVIKLSKIRKADPPHGEVLAIEESVQVVRKLVVVVTMRFPNGETGSKTFGPNSTIIVVH